MATNTIESTIIAAYKSDAKAQAAVQDLDRNNVQRDHIHVHSDGGTRTGPQHEGGFMAWVKSLFGEDDTAYTSAYKDGNTIVAVDASNNEIDAIADILDRYDPVDLQAQSATAAAAAGTQNARRETSSSVPVVEEDIAVGKRSYQRGGVRVYTHVVDKPVEEKVRLRDERVYVDRQAVDRPATADDLRGRQDQVMEVKEFAEEPVMEKRARVVEEVRIGKDVSDRTETVRDSVRRTEVDVQPLAARAGSDIDDADFRSHFQQTYGASGANYSEYGPAYEYGYTSASESKYRSRSFDEAETDLRSGYERTHPNSTWEKMKDSVRYGWNRVTGRA
jgi:stress response protein YsnF